jgi:methylthioribose-1-phosphate isomerase
MGTNTLLAIGIGVVVVLAVVRIAPTLYAKATGKAADGSTTTPANDPLVAFLRKAKADITLSAPSRMTACALISTLESMAEQLPNLDERKQARDECKSLGAKFIVTPTPAAAVDSGPADTVIPKV